MASNITQHPSNEEIESAYYILMALKWHFPSQIVCQIIERGCGVEKFLQVESKKNWWGNEIGSRRKI
jgi:hypothetical protein